MPDQQLCHLERNIVPSMRSFAELICFRLRQICFEVMIEEGNVLDTSDLMQLALVANGVIKAFEFDRRIVIPVILCSLRPPESSSTFPKCLLAHVMVDECQNGPVKPLARSGPIEVHPQFLQASSASSKQELV
ncbi:hypothetical protein Tco_0114854 [Tanacetum coccineum]